MDEILQSNNKDKVFVLVGNNSDPGIREEVYYEEGYLKAKQAGIMFIEVSSNTNENIIELFQGISNSMET